MLKPPSPSAFLLPQRLKLVSLASSSPSPSTPAQQQSNPLHTDAAVATATASLPHHHDHRQPILLVSHQAVMAQQQPDSPSPTQRTLAATYFPLGYKEAAQQWVSPSPLSSVPPPHPLTLSPAVDRHLGPPG